MKWIRSHFLISHCTQSHESISALSTDIAVLLYYTVLDSSYCNIVIVAVFFYSNLNVPRYHCTLSTELCTALFTVQCIALLCTVYHALYYIVHHTLF